MEEHKKRITEPLLKKVDVNKKNVTESKSTWAQVQNIVHSLKW